MIAPMPVYQEFQNNLSYEQQVQIASGSTGLVDRVANSIVYTPTQMPSINTCSHCSPGTPSIFQTSFYTYPCGRTHLAHEACILKYLREETRPGCTLCVRDYGIPLPPPPPTPKKPWWKDKKTVTVLIISALAFLAGIALVLIA